MQLFVSLVLVVLASSANAIGLGAAIGTPLLGKALRLDIALTGHSGTHLGSDCFSLENAPGTSDELYFPHAARAYAETRQGKTFVVISAPEITQPVVEFRLSIECGVGLARDFLLLVDLPTLDTQQKEDAPTDPLSAPQVAGSLAPQDVTYAVDVEPLRLQQDTTLEVLAREQYPLQPKARRKFKRLIQAANSELLQAGKRFDRLLLPSGTELAMPHGLPEQRYRSNGALVHMEVVARHAPAPPPRSSTVKRKVPEDRLTVGATDGLVLTADEFDTTRDRLVLISAEQAKVQETLFERIRRTQNAFDEIKQNALQMQTRISALEDERKELRRKSVLAQTWQLALAVLLGGVIGAGILHAYIRPASKDEYAA